MVRIRVGNYGSLPRPTKLWGGAKRQYGPPQDQEKMNTPFTLQRKLSMLALLVGVCVMGYGLIFLGWYINQVAAIFMIVSVVMGLINR